MKGIIVNKTVIDIETGNKTEFFALCSSEPQPNSLKYSLTFEGYITGWTKDRTELEAYQ